MERAIPVQLLSAQVAMVEGMSGILAMEFANSFEQIFTN